MSLPLAGMVGAPHATSRLPRVQRRSSGSLTYVTHWQPATAGLSSVSFASHRATQSAKLATLGVTSRALGVSGMYLQAVKRVGRDVSHKASTQQIQAGLTHVSSRISQLSQCHMQAQIQVCNSPCTIQGL
jgi:hypothetical protein